MRRGWLACALFPLSLVFRVMSAARRTAYRLGMARSTRMPVPIIVVGNIFVGGTGKTPFTIWLVQQLRRAGYVPGVISRGYGAHHDNLQEVDAQSSPATVGDEPLLIAHRARCPVVVGRNRVAAAQTLLARHPEVNLIVSDDGLQHYALQRDVEIVLCDERGNGNGWTLPAGPLREPASRRRDFTIVNGEHQPAGLQQPVFRMQLAGDQAQRLSAPSQTVALQELPAMAGVSQPRIVAAAGIGNPARFFAMLRNAGLDIAEMPLPDHFAFSENPFAQIPADIILVTEKDAVKCMQLDTLRNDPRLWVVPVTARLDGALAERIVEKVRGRPTA
ncbi:tetraacyldisaccharide 4'-kinase [Noviherbaspirillum sp. UKPF54]|uniref:tetraacyldisaccharide 4'-kinase n=1 Tax=Noviherbaspirillum sp. UKPF54 TaxID=2601898 RepID=UPI001FED3206|nr:tetraacyldisaccharide 4'-kinase [Noviherbaspirillum sp. UKPF54]